MRYKYYFCEIQKPELLDWLNQNQVKHKITGGGITPVFVSFSIWSDASCAETQLAQLKHLCHRGPLVYADYSNAEINNAKYLTIRPKRQCVDIINAHTAFDYSCEWVTPGGLRKVKHMEQKGILTIAQEPNAKTKTAFWCESTGFSVVFTDQRIVDLAKNNNLAGIEFNRVLKKGGMVSDTIYQINSSKPLMKDCICLGHGERKEICHICGKEQFFVDSSYQLHMDFSKITESYDFYVTERIFGEGTAYPMYLISQKFYRLIKENDLAANVTFCPVAEGKY